MNPPNNAADAAPIRVGLVADGESAPALAAAIRACPDFELPAIAVAGDSVEAPDSVARYDDARALLAQAGVRAVVLGVSPRQCAELARLALARNIAVWMPPPAAREFAEAIELFDRALEARTPLRIGSWWELVRDDVRALLRKDESFKASFSELWVSTAGPPLHSWRSSLVDAGGGVLLSDAHDLLEALVAVRGLPENVSAAIGRCRRRRNEAPRETEDLATVILRYSSGQAAWLRATWDLPPYEQRLWHHGAARSVWHDMRQARLCEAGGEIVEERALPGDYPAADLRRFAREIRGLATPEELEATRERQLAVAALIETIYLSTRTGQPESPRQRFEVSGRREPRL